jgi:hypothetical protein
VESPSGVRNSDIEEVEGGTGYALLDFMFTVAISIGLTPELLQDNFHQGVLAEGWIRSGQRPSAADLFNLAVLGLGLLVLTLSWSGYRSSARARRKMLYQGSMHMQSLINMIGFYIDIILVALYGFMMIQFRDFGQVLWILTAVFVLYSIWDLLKVSPRIHIYCSASWPSKLRELVWIPTAAFCALLSIYVSSINTNSAFSLIIAILLVLIPRFPKIWCERA